jgi:hypothetical protein
MTALPSGGEDRGGEDRLSAARALLADAGVFAPASPAGMEGEIIAVRGKPELRVRLTELAPAIRALGYRYVALELSGEDNDDEDT